MPGCNNELATHGTHVWATVAEGSLSLSALALLKIFKNLIQNKVANHKSAFFKILIKRKQISMKTLDQNQVHFKPVNQKLSKAVPPQVPPRTWQGGHGCAGRGTTGAPPSASESSAGEVVAPA